VLPGYEVLYGDALGSAAITAALAKLEDAGSSSRPKRGRQAVAAAHEEAGRGSSGSGESGLDSCLAAAVAAVNTLALVLTPGEADAANERHCPC